MGFQFFGQVIVGVRRFGFLVEPLLQSRGGLCRLGQGRSPFFPPVICRSIVETPVFVNVVGRVPHVDRSEDSVAIDSVVAEKLPANIQGDAVQRVLCQDSEPATRTRRYSACPDPLRPLNPTHAERALDQLSIECRQRDPRRGTEVARTFPVNCINPLRWAPLRGCVCRVWRFSGTRCLPVS